MPFFGQLSELAPGGYGPGAGPFAKLYAPSHGGSRKAGERALGFGKASRRIKSGQCDDSSAFTGKHAWPTLSVAAQSTAAGNSPGDTSAQPNFGSLQARDDAGDFCSDDDEMLEGRVGSISGRRRGIRGSRMHDVPVINREPKGVKRRRARRRVRRFVRSLPEVRVGRGCDGRDTFITLRLSYSQEP